jgi:hypothetical protein
MENGIERTIYHEAAHAVVSLALGVKVNRLAIWAKDGRVCGSVRHDPTPYQPLIAIAGMVGEALRFGDARYDPEESDSLLVSHLPIDRQDQFAREAAEILRKNWTAWDEVAKQIEVLDEEPIL